MPQREPDKCTWPVEQTAQPPVHPFEREHGGTYDGGQHDTELAGVSARVEVVEKQQQDQQDLDV